jgi:hypothetical protein
VETKNLLPEFHVEVNVEAGQRLVHQQRTGSQDEGASESDALLLSSRQRGWLRSGVLQKIDSPEHLTDPLVTLESRDPLRLEPELEVSAHRKMRPEREILEDHADVPPLGRHDDLSIRGREHAADLHAAAVRSVEAGKEPKSGRLPAAGRSEESDPLALSHLEREAAERLPRAVLLPYIRECQRGDGRLRENNAPRSANGMATPTSSSMHTAEIISGRPFAISVNRRTGNGSLPGG